MKKTKLLSIFSVSLLAIGIFFAGSPKALAQFSGQNGRVLYIAQTGGNPTTAADFNSREIYSINSNGTSPLRLTTNNLYDNWPKSSKDGTKIVWYQCNWTGVYPAQVNTCEIWIMDFDKPETAKQLTDNVYADTQPAFSPDGSRIIFVSSRDSSVVGANQTVDLYSMKTDGTDVVRLTNFATTTDGPIDNDVPSSYAGTFPNYAPDGNYVYFSRYIGDPDTGYYNIWRVSAASTGGGNLNLAAVTTGSSLTCGVASATCPIEDGHPDVSPDGKKLVFHSNRGSVAGQIEKYSIYQLNIESGLPKNTADMQVVSDTASSFPNPVGQYALWPTFSPDGSNIVYTRYPGPDSASGTRGYSYMLTVGSSPGATPSLLTVSSAISVTPTPNLLQYTSSVGSYWAATQPTPPTPPSPTPTPVTPSTPSTPDTSLARSEKINNGGYRVAVIGLTSIMILLLVVLAANHIKTELVSSNSKRKRR